MTQYGLISETDSRTLERTVDLICENVEVNGVINVTEIGVYGGDTGFGITDYIASKNRNCFLTGVENYKDGEKVRIVYDKLIIGNSNEVYNQLEDNSQHLIFVDGDHSFIGVISDFFAYADKVKKGGYFCFHDAGEHIKPFKDFQHGDQENPDSYISVRKALESIGLFGLPKKRKPVGVWIDIDALENVDMGSGKQMDIEDIIKMYDQTGYIHYKPQDEMFFYPGWELIFDEADETNEAGGICVFKKLY